MPNKSLKVLLELENNKFKAGLNQANRDMKGFAGSAAKISAGIFAAFSVQQLISGLYTANNAFETSRVATESLRNAIKQQGLDVETLTIKYKAMAEAIQGVTNFEDDAILQAQSVLQQYIGNIEITEDLTRATVDFAAAQKMDLDSAFKLVGKSIGSNTNGLGRYGIQIDSGSSKTEKLAQVTVALEQRFKGAATAAVTTGQQLRNIWGDFLENIGERVAPIIDNINLALIFMLRVGGELVKDWSKLGNISQVIQDNWMKTAQDYAQILKNRQNGKAPAIEYDENSVIKNIKKAKEKEIKTKEDIEKEQREKSLKNLELKSREDIAINDYTAIEDLKKRVELEQEKLKLYKKGTDDYQEQLILKLEAEKNFADEVKRINDDAQNKIKETANKTADVVVDNFEALINRSKSFKDIMRDILNDIGRTMLKKQVVNLTERILTPKMTTLLGFASGGVIPGSYQQATPIMAHGSEMVLNPSQQANLMNIINYGQSQQGSQPVVVLNMNLQSLDPSKAGQVFKEAYKTTIKPMIINDIANTNQMRTAIRSTK